jgi:Arc/MetJ family transcription regulator
VANVKRTTVNLDTELVGEAREILGARNTTDTVHAALRDVVRRERLRRLSEWDCGGMTLEDLKEMRKPRILTREWGMKREDLEEMRKPRTFG